MDITSRVRSAVDIATRALSQLYQVGERWKNAPREVTQLRETVARFCRLLESIQHAGAGAGAADADVDADAIETPGQHRTAKGLLVTELEGASNTLRELEDVVGQVHPLPALASRSSGQEVDVAAARGPTLRGTWSVQRPRAMKLLHELNNQHQRILATWSLLNMCGTYLLHHLNPLATET